MLVALVCLLSYRARRARPSTGAPIAIVTGLVATSLLLGMASYWHCSDADNTSFFTPLAWAASLLQGGGIEQQLDRNIQCPPEVPVALEMAKLLAIGAFAVGVVGVVIGLFRAQSDRIRVRFFTRSVTAVVGVDDDSVSMVAAVARTLVRRSRLVLITASADRSCVHEVRNFGAAVLQLDDSRPETLESLRLWRKLDRLYMLSPDPASNLLRLGIISRRLSEIGRKRRLPLIVRIDDPWQAEAWRAKQFGGSDSQWAADAVGKYEVTARRLLDRVVGQEVRRVVVCGTSQLTLALCADMAQRRLERSYYADPSQPDLPKLTLVGEKADEYRDDHQLRQEQLGVPEGQLAIDVVSESPTVRVLTRVIDEDPGTDAIILVDADPTGLDPTVGTRLAARFPAVPIYAWDPNAQVTDDRPPIVGQLHTYRLAMDLPAGHAQDAWERAAMLIHERYAADVGRTSDSTQPWAQLDEFYRGSNRRQVANALWMVERIGGHTWNTSAAT